jgi:hypothetical protein
MVDAPDELLAGNRIAEFREVSSTDDTKELVASNRLQYARDSQVHEFKIRRPAAQVVTCTEITVPITRVPRKLAIISDRPLTPSTAAMIALPTHPAVAPISQHFQKGRGGSSRLRLVDRKVYVPKQKNSFPD